MMLIRVMSLSISLIWLVENFHFCCCFETTSSEADKKLCQIEFSMCNSYLLVILAMKIKCVFG